MTTTPQSRRFRCARSITPRASTRHRSSAAIPRPAASTPSTATSRSSTSPHLTCRGSLTPAAPNDDADDPDSPGLLRPWIVLVCVEESAAELIPGADGRPARLFVDANQLPDLAESFAWAHVQSAVPRKDVVASLNDNPGAVLARLVCPRRLAPNTRYRVAIVAAFAAEDDTVVPAWPRAEGDEELIVYDTWTMSTGEAGSFEELCDRLGPVDDPTLVLGLHSTDVTELGPVDPWPTRERSAS